MSRRSLLSPNAARESARYLRAAAAAINGTYLPLRSGVQAPASMISCCVTLTRCRIARTRQVRHGSRHNEIAEASAVVSRRSRVNPLARSRRRPPSGRSRLNAPAAPMNVSMWAPQPWIQAAEAVADWYGVMFRLAFGLERVNSRSSVTVPPAPPNEHPESPRVAPLHSMPAAPVQLRPKRRKSPSVPNSRPRSSKTSGVRRSRRAA